MLECDQNLEHSLHVKLCWWKFSFICNLYGLQFLPPNGLYKNELNKSLWQHRKIPSIMYASVILFIVQKKSRLLHGTAPTTQGSVMKIYPANLSDKSRFRLTADDELILPYGTFITKSLLEGTLIMPQQQTCLLKRLRLALPWASMELSCSQQ